MGLWSTSDEPNQPSRRAARQSKSRAFATCDQAIKWIERIIDGTFVYHWDYETTNNTLALRVARFQISDGKQFRPLHQTADGWIVGDPPGVLPIYKLLRVRASSGRVFIVEGEKCADAVNGLGLVATTSSHGAGSAAKSDWSPLADRAVAHFPDHDSSGTKYATEVAQLVHSLDPPAQVKIVELPGLSEGEDVFDFIQKRRAAGCDDATIRAELEQLADDAPIWKATAVQKRANGASKASPSSLSKLRDRLLWRPFPTTILPAPIAQFIIEAAAALGCDEAMIALPVLAVLASAIGTTRRIMLKRSWREPCVVWSIIIARSGQLKSPALDKALEPIHELQRRAFREHKEQMAKYRDALNAYHRAMREYNSGNAVGPEPQKPEQPVVSRYILEDCTVEALCVRLEEQEDGRGLLLGRDELSGLFAFDAYKKAKGNDAAHYLKMHGARDIYVDRKTGDKTTLFVPRAAVSITGSVQPKILARVLGREHFENGFAARSLMAMPRPRAKRWTNRSIHPNVEGEYHRVVNELFALKHALDEHGERVPVDVPLTPEAIATWAVFYDEHGETQVDAESEDEAAAFAKLEGYAARFALIVHCIRCVSGDAAVDDRYIDAASIRAGIELARWFVYETSRVYQELAETGEDHEAVQLIDLIRRNGGRITPRELQQRRNKFKRSVELASDALQELVDSELGVWEYIAPGSSGGQPSKVFVISRQTPENDSNANDTHASAPENGGIVGVDSVDAPRQTDLTKGKHPPKRDNQNSGGLGDFSDPDPTRWAK